MQEVEELYYLCSENKDADQLRGYREADLHLCFRKCKKPVFSRRGSNVNYFLGRLCRLVYLTGVHVLDWNRGPSG